MTSAILFLYSTGTGITDVNIEFIGLSPDSVFLTDVAGPFLTECN